MPITPKEMIKKLQKNGFEVIGTRGSHVKLRNEKTGKQTEVPMHNGDLAKGIEHSILKQAGLK
ncbi:MAG: type II toxin-antitoxin system HicA family toxin [Clostridiales bacterium]|nr:type II toxin-antitoxin system HicA family toxin [Clostridiales bacterium]